ncbi:MAG TPA: ketoacyl-ACP synthase III [Williamwhitmania sp.]|nr:ketoacyl-ACP synthase III [Williamwhitmania sp.]
MNPRISAVSAFAPKKVVTNHDFEKQIDTTDEWIKTRTGISERHYAAETEFTTDLCVEAALRMVTEEKVSIDDTDFIIVATITPDQIFPSVASQVANRLGLNSVGAMDISAACAGWVYGLIMAQSLVASGMYKKILVFGGETLTKITDFTDRTTCILFGDAAGVAIIENGAAGKMYRGLTGTSGEGGKDLYMTHLSDVVNGVKVIDSHKIVQNGKAVFKWAVQTVSDKIGELLRQNNLTVEDIDWFIPHSANMRIIESITQSVGLPMSKTLESIQLYGNTSSASIPLAIYEGLKSGKLKKGHKILLFGFGGGLTYAGTILEL